MCKKLHYMYTCSTLDNEYNVVFWFHKFKHMNVSMAGNTSTQRYRTFMLLHGCMGGIALTWTHAYLFQAQFSDNRIQSEAQIMFIIDYYHYGLCPPSPFRICPSMCYCTSAHVSGFLNMYTICCSNVTST